LVTEIYKNRPPNAQKVKKITATPERLHEDRVNPYGTQAGVRYGTISWYSVGQSESEIGEALDHLPPETTPKQSKTKSPKK
jgi:hypothetical protein